MSEEEKKAIKYLEFLSNERCECEVCQNAKKQYKTILNLIDKQQKEIERDKLYTDFYKDLCDKQQKEIEKLKEVKYYYEISRISKDKIREKIKNVSNGVYDAKLILNELLEENEND